MAACRSLALVILAIVAVSVTGAGAADCSKSFNITNSCSYTVWPAISSAATSAAPDSTGFELAPGQSEMVAVSSSGWSGRVWGRTLCTTTTTTDSRSGDKFTCVTGDCGSGRQDCAGGNAAPPVTLAQFTLHDDGSGEIMDSYDVSVVDGFNLPMLVAPQQGAAAPAAGGNCAPTGCVADLNAACPAELRVMSSAAATSTGAVAACKSACLAFGSPQYCCTGERYGDPSTCEPTVYSHLFKSLCPRAYSYAYDGGVGSTCAGGDTCTTYSITFCPSWSTTSGNTSTNPSSEPEPPGNGNLPQIYGGGGGGGGGGSQAVEPWRIVLVVAVLGLVTAALGALAQFLGLFNLCFNSPIQGAGGAGGPNYPSCSMQINHTSVQALN